MKVAPPCLGQNGTGYVDTGSGASHGEVMTVLWPGDDRGGKEKGGSSSEVYYATRP